MKTNSLFSKKYVFLTLIIISAYTFTGAIKYFQTAKFNNNGSGKITITYSANNSEINDNNKIIGNLPFTEDKVREYFTADGIVVEKALVYTVKAEPEVTYVTADINITSLNKIKEVKGFTGVDASWVKADSGMVFRWLFTQSHKNTNSIATYQINANFESPVKSTNGVLEGKEIKWYVFGDKMNPGGAYFEATINSDGTTAATNNSSNSTATTTPTTTPKETKPPEKKTETEEKKCGVFGMELPLILLGGLFIFYNKRNKKRYFFKL